MFAIIVQFRDQFSYTTSVLLQIEKQGGIRIKIPERGHVILMPPNNRFTAIISSLTYCPWSHVGLSLGTGEYIDLSFPKRSQIISRYPSSYKVIKHIDLDKQKADAMISRYLDSYARTEYDVEKIIYLFQTLTQGYNRDLVPVGNKNKHTCASLVGKLHDEVFLEIVDGIHWSQLMPIDFDVSPYFETVYQHMKL